MNAFVERRTAPQAGEKQARPPQRLSDIMYEGFYALFLLKNGCGPQDKVAFADNMTGFLADVDRNAKALGISAEDVTAAKYAFCSAVDEIILRSSFEVREAWETRPLQLRVFGDQLAGEHFFHRLEDLRAKGAVHVEALEVFHMCLLLGFQGRYALDGRDKLDYLVARLGDEIARMRGRTRGFAPHAERPDQVVNPLRSDLSLWVLGTVFLVAGLGAYLGFRTALSRETDGALAQYNDLVKLPPKAAHVTITLP
ncbi:type IVB secretion system protein IcmH/DotU [Massilia sp. G4R7]|uniref:Type IVB secretion system protein IcmH/DotU n=1 Tax=Massilia phyllostachyos TaxID=2898585 RepID=A0ABS8Q3J9_9BURK|nr:type IVB secretion system protein IcmH/DotU [Massilia phyllostachyos]MCD2516327.1 type IVB secretion system protein IcmH/DotU [Massilia phyllostachyos]